VLLNVELERDPRPVGVAPEPANDEPSAHAVDDEEVVVTLAR